MSNWVTISWFTCQHELSALCVRVRAVPSRNTSPAPLMMSLPARRRTQRPSPHSSPSASPNSSPSSYSSAMRVREPRPGTSVVLLDSFMSYERAPEAIPGTKKKKSRKGKRRTPVPSLPAEEEEEDRGGDGGDDYTLM